MCQCRAVARLLKLIMGNEAILSLGYSRKKPNREVEDMEFPGVLKKLEEKFPRVNQK